MIVKNLSLHTLILGIGISFFASCTEKDKLREALVIPTVYESPAFSTHAATQIAVTNQLINLTTEIKKGRVNGGIVTKTALDNLFTTGATSLKNVANIYYASKIEGVGGWFDELAKASGSTYTPSATLTGNGGTYNGYLFDENGLELEQMIEKGQFGAVLYQHLQQLLSGNITEATIDQALAIIGANPTFANSSDANKHPQPDKLLAVYIARRDKNDGKGLYAQLKQNFLKLKASVRAGADYTQERNEAIAEIKNIVEKANFATVINYCHSVIATMSATNPTDVQKAAALHAYGECVGFTHGFRTVAGKRITDAQIDEVLTLLNAPYNAAPTSYKFITDAVNELPKLQQIITKLRDIYGFTTQEIEDFKKNWVTEQGR